MPPSNRNYLFIIVILALAALGLILWQRTHTPRIERFERVQIGMTRADVHKFLGNPLPLANNIPVAPANPRIATLDEWEEQGCTLVVWYDKAGVVVSRLLLP